MKMSKLILFFSVTALIMFASLSDAENTNKQRSNKQNVVAFYNAVVNQKNFDLAAPYLGNYYTQHNPTAADGIQGLKNFITFLNTNYPLSHSEIKKVFADHNYVILHVHSMREPDTLGRAIVDIFRLENGKIVEHWDVIENIPTNSANLNGMF